MKRLFCFFAFFLAFAFTGVLQATDAENQITQANAKIQQLTTGLNYIYQKDGFSTKASYSGNAPAKESFDPSTKCVILSFRDKTLSVELRKDTLKLVGFMNGLAWELVRGASAPKYSSAKKAEWSNEHAIKIAHAAAAILFPEMAQQTQVTSCRFISDGKQDGQYREGHWMVILRRMSAKGYPFRSDFINFDVSESVGIVAGYMRIPSDYKEEDFTPISQSQAKNAAAKGIEQFKKSIVGSTFIDNSTSITPKSEGSLQIVNPPNINASSVEEWVYSVGATGRLAWVFDYALITPIQNSPQSVNSQRITIFIDAKNGDFIGADF